MKYFKIILFSFLIISSSNANTIFYLIKIPNLNIYEDNSNNGLKYLYPSKSFEAGIMEKSVRCNMFKKNDYKENFENIKKNFDKYSTNFIGKINLKFIVLCKDLYIGNIKALGFANHSKRTIILDISFDKSNIGRIAHHELFHILNDNYKEIFNYNDWKSFNFNNFNYSKCSTCSTSFDLELLDNTNGFLTEYSKSTISEDMAETFSFLMTDYKNILKKSKNDKILIKKINFIEKKIFEIDKQFKF